MNFVYGIPGGLGNDIGGACRDMRVYEGSIAEEGKQNKLDNYLNKVMTISGQMGTLRWTMSANERWKDFLILELARLTAFQHYQNHLKQDPQNMIHIGDPGLISSSHSPSLGAGEVGKLGVASPLILPFP